MSEQILDELKELFGLRSFGSMELAGIIVGVTPGGPFGPRGSVGAPGGRGQRFELETCELHW